MTDIFPSNMLQIEDICIRTCRRMVRRLSLTVHPDGQIVMVIPPYMTDEEATRFAISKLPWLRKARERVTQKAERRVLPITNEQAEALVDFLNERVEYWRIKMGEGPITWKIRNMRSQWGNCRHMQRRITFNLQLARIEHQLVDYIIVHELAHLRHPNHSPQFHAWVQQFIPDERERRRRLHQA